MSEQANGKTRVSQRPGSIPCTLADLDNPDTIDRLRSALNVGTFVRDLAQSTTQIQSTEGVLPCISISK